MRCSRDDDEFLLAAEHRKRNAVQFNDLDVVASDDEERGRPHLEQSRIGEVGAPAP
jgi:hypothetical protein